MTLKQMWAIGTIGNSVNAIAFIANGIIPFAIVYSLTTAVCIHQYFSCRD